jgi:RimJ/RimL family protein N-acetyltransferase
VNTLSSPRLHLRPFTGADAPIVLALLTDPDWHRFIGDSGARTLEHAQAWLRDGPLAMYAAHGLGLLAVELRDTGEAAGTCGLIRREGVPDVDLGFAFLPAHRGRGLAREAAAAVLHFGCRQLGIPRILAYVAPDNDRSVRLLTAIGMRPDGAVTLPGSAEPLSMFSSVAGGIVAPSESRTTWK